jgi:hypothetical protein
MENNDRALNQTRELARLQVEGTERAMERQAENMSHAQEEALSHQAETFRNEQQSQNESNQSTIHRLENEIKEHTTSGDLTWVSPVAEARMRDGFIKEYGKKHDAEVQRHKDKTDSLQKEYTQRMASTIEAADARVTQTELQRRADEHLQRQTLMNHIDEVQQSKEQMLRDKDYQATRQSEALNHTYGSSLDRQRREYEAMINQIKIDSNEKITSVRQQADFDAKTAQRNFATQQYELTKGFERKMEEQKNAYEDTINTLKEQLGAQSHEAERRTRQLLDEQAKGYEQKIAQIEYQTKERERSISDNYQDQIEKLKRSNALLIQRKS